MTLRVLLTSGRLWDHNAPWGTSHSTSSSLLCAPGVAPHDTYPLSPLSARIPLSAAPHVPVPSWPLAQGLPSSSWQGNGQVQGHLLVGSKRSNSGDFRGPGPPHSWRPGAGPPATEQRCSRVGCRQLSQARAVPRQGRSGDALALLKGTASSESPPLH